VGYLKDHASRGIKWIKGDIHNTIIVVPGIDKEKDQISLEVIQSNTRTLVKIEDGRPTFTVKVSVHAHVTEAKTQQLDLSTAGVYEMLNRRLATSIESEMQETIKQTKELQTDVLGFGAALGRAYPKEWEKIKSQWNDNVFPYVDVKLEVEAHVVRSGFLLKPAQAK
jgi:spore germination protein KC